VRENIAFGLRVQRRPREEIEARVSDLLELVQLGQLGARMPSQLSGGQRQRVAFARALATQPSVLLLDEPFGALDARVRLELRDWLHELHARTHVTTLLVTHDQDEALELADRVVVVNEGRIEQVGTPDDVYRRPATPFVFGFLGEANWLATTVDGRKARVGFRPDDLEIALGPLDGHAFAARVRRVQSLGARAKLELVSEAGSLVQAEVPAERVRTLALSPGAEVYAAPRELQVYFD
jgi:sulfate transport system ATP-binding protein